MRHFGIVAFSLCSVATAAEKPPEPLDGIHRTFHDPLLDRMVGRWQLTGNVMARPVENDFSAEWVLNHQFLQLHFKANEPPSKDHPAYEALVFIGYDNTSGGGRAKR